MARFFAAAAALGTALYVAALFLGHFGAQFGALPFHHLVVGLSAGIAAVSLHCLVFAIFTGAGKDTRLLTEDLGLDPRFHKRMKAFKMEVFPPALYAILAVLVVTALGGARSTSAGAWIDWLHPIAAWLVFYYNTRVFVQEYRAIKENASILARVNEEAGRRAAPPAAPKIAEVPVLADAVEELAWGTHVYALGRFLTFLAYNTWLPYVYLRFIVGYITMPWWPYLLLSLGLYLGGAYLKVRYREHQPGAARPIAPRG